MCTTYDLEAVGNDSDSHKLLAVVATVHHERVGETLNDGALGLAEALCSISARGVRDVDGAADLNVITARIISEVLALLLVSIVRQGNISDFDILVAPLVEQLYGANLGGNVLGEDGRGSGGNFDFDLAVVRHIGGVEGMYV